MKRPHDNEPAQEDQPPDHRARLEISCSHLHGNLDHADDLGQEGKEIKQLAYQSQQLGRGSTRRSGSRRSGVGQLLDALAAEESGTSSSGSVGSVPLPLSPRPHTPALLKITELDLLRREHLITLLDVSYLDSKISLSDPEKPAKKNGKERFTISPFYKEKRSIFKFCDVKGAFPRCYGVFCVFFNAHDYHHFSSPTFLLSSSSPLSLLFSLSPSVVSSLLLSLVSFSVLCCRCCCCCVCCCGCCVVAAAALLLLDVGAGGGVCVVLRCCCVSVQFFVIFAGVLCHSGHC